MRRYSILIFFLINFILFSNQSVYAAVAWKKLKGKDFTIYYQKEAWGRSALKITAEEYGKVTDFFRFKPAGEIKIYVYSDKKRFLEIAPSEKTMGLARPFSSEIAVLARDGMLPSVISHELVHIVMLQSIPNTVSLPFWFVEGIAIYLSEPQLTEVDLERYALQGDLRDVEELRGKPASEEEGKAAAQGYLITKLIVEKFGKESLRNIVFLMQKGTSFDTALEKTSGLTYENLQGEWEKFGVRRKRESLLLNLRILGFLILGALSLFVSVVWLIRFRRKLAITEAEAKEMEKEMEKEI